jgi:type II secretory pathway component PulJ
VNQEGHTLLEVVLSVLLLAVALVPLLQLYPALLSGNRAYQESALLAVAASGKLEELAQGLRGGSVGAATGSEACPAPVGCRLVWTVQDLQTHPTAGWLRHVSVVACSDANSSGTCDPGEVQVRYETRVTSRP